MKKILTQVRGVSGEENFRFSKLSKNTIQKTKIKHNPAYFGISKEKLHHSEDFDKGSKRFGFLVAIGLWGRG
jgi:hypothetical protein